MNERTLRITVRDMGEPHTVRVIVTDHTDRCIIAGDFWDGGPELERAVSEYIATWLRRAYFDITDPAVGGVLPAPRRDERD